MGPYEKYQCRKDLSRFREWFHFAAVHVASGPGELESSAQPSSAISPLRCCRFCPLSIEAFKMISGEVTRLQAVRPGMRGQSERVPLRQENIFRKIENMQ